MKKLKKILIPLLMIMCIPLFLAGCSSNNGIHNESNTNSGKVWYVINSKNKVKAILFIKKNKLDYAAGLSESLCHFFVESPVLVAAVIDLHIGDDNQ